MQSKKYFKGWEKQYVVTEIEAHKFTTDVTVLRARLCVSETQGEKKILNLSGDLWIQGITWREKNNLTQNCFSIVHIGGGDSVEGFANKYLISPHVLDISVPVMEVISKECIKYNCHDSKHMSS